ncbi:MAG: DUF4350 domain-containing protein [Ornithinimicrobium sp.]|uniref:DUF4350 domain-containing protein n=1 Tax=Ornithinimicrobium sp. TaxID=1977084 RepID=UPI003D9B49C1
MSTAVSPDTGISPSPDGSSDTSGAEGSTTAAPRRSHRRWLTWTAVVLGFVVLSAVVSGLTARQGAPLDPDNPDANGAQAVARVLADQGVEVEVVRGLSALRATSTDGATVLVGGTAYLSADSGRDVVRETREAAGLLVLDPTGDVGEILDLPVSASGFGNGATLAPDCDLDLWRDGDRVVGADTLIAVTEGDTSAQICLPPSAGYNAGGSQAGHVVVLPETSDRPRTTLLGIGPSLRNDQVADAANAATWLRLLGADSARLVWYVPVPSDVGIGSPRSLTDVLPDAVVPSAALAVLALGALALVRGRRLGPVVTEPLPVVVRSIETTQSRAQLYPSAQDRRRALAVLQLAARRRWATRLALGPTTEPDALVTAVSAATDRPAAEISRLLTDPTAPDDQTLVRIARELRSLDEGNTSR